MSENKKRYRITNITAMRGAGPGFVLDHSGGMIGRGKAKIVSDIDAILEEWHEKGWISIVDADTGMSIGGTQPSFSAGPALREASPQDEKDAFGEEFEPEDIDLSDAVEAALPNGAHMPSLAQESKSKTRISLSNEDHGPGLEHSPIPGDKPRSVDDSDQFTIKAPRSNQVGQVIR